MSVLIPGGKERHYSKTAVIIAMYAMSKLLRIQLHVISVKITSITCVLACQRKQLQCDIIQYSGWVCTTCRYYGPCRHSRHLGICHLGVLDISCCTIQANLSFVVPSRSAICFTRSLQRYKVDIWCQARHEIQVIIDM